MIDPTALRVLADDPGMGEAALLARLERTLRRRARVRLLTSVAATLLVVLVGVEAGSMTGARLRPQVLGPAALPQDDCVGVIGARGLRLAAGAAALVLAACTDGGVDPDPAGGSDALGPGAIIEVVGDDMLAGTHVYPQISEAGLFPIDREVADQAGLEPGAHAVDIELLDDDFDWVRISGSIDADGTARLFPSFRIDGMRYEAPDCVVTMEALPPGVTAGQLVCREMAGEGGAPRITVTGRFLVPDLQESEFG